MKQLENYGVQKINASETVNIDGGIPTYPGGCSNGGGSQYSGPSSSGAHNCVGLSAASMSNPGNYQDGESGSWLGGILAHYLFCD